MTDLDTPAPWTDRVRHYLSGTWMDGRSTHQRVRLAMYGVLLLLVALGVLRGVLSQQWQEDRQLDIEVLESISEQRLLAQHLGLRVQQLQNTAVGPAQLAVVRASGRSLQQESARLDALVTLQAGRAPLSSVAALSGLQEWRDSREALWPRLEALLAVAPGERAEAQARVLDLQAALQRAEMAVAALTQSLNTDMEQRSRRLVTAIWGIVGGIVLLALLLALAVVEPTARAVRRQHGVLSQQADRLKRLAMVAELSSNAIAITDGAHRVVWVNQTFSDLTGYSQRMARSRRIGTLLKARSADPTHFTEFTEALARGEGIKREVRVVTRNTELGWVLVDMQPIREPDGSMSGWAFVATDLTEVRSQQEMLSLAVSGAGLGIWHWDLVSDTVGWNERMEHMLGYPTGSLTPRSATWAQLVHPDDLPAWTDSMRQHLRDETREHRISVRLRQHSGRWVWILFAGRAADRTVQGRVLRLAGVAMDVNAQKTLEQQLRTAARTDDLTALPNRAVMLEMIRAAIARRSVEPGYHFAVLFMDFDRFKQVNDTLGHTVGDALLRQIARRLEDSLRPGDALAHGGDFDKVAARIGGDEFVVLLDNIRGDLDAIHVASRLLDVLSAPYLVETHRVSSTVSIGIVSSIHVESDADSVLRDADIAMYEAKRTGRARYVMFEPGMRSQVNDSVSLENDLRDALAQGEMHVVFQPLVHLPGYALAGMEALVRWRHPVRGAVSPVDFIPLAEACGVIGALGQFVLLESCRTFEMLQQTLGPLAPPTLSVNLSRAQLREPGLVADVRDALRTFQMEPHQLVLEVTESLAAQDAQVHSTLQALRAMGVALALDDFGTGYSSLSCLHELPVHAVKIDKSFINQLGDSQYHRVLVEATLRVAQTLDLGTVAEGIETREQAEMVAGMGCSKGQGYWFGRPMDAAALVAWVQQRNTDTA
ncbi:putative bifunctional diguanylate cyclase/phosphodiesterase [Rhodoferax bucti]|uniref:putative bifunctional diguanylate cyclase/phosphodiesterase n=1 Tax=Rhodoferax bucti TaxID=2576305 RepID=UPI001109681D|nr:EAL domain-containing protein [Rhodoferax bucti]